ncbi:MAG: DNA adenine methylase [Synergistes sp.]|nr:DNA adenine methylase [Synergistes sp.]
MRPFIKWPGGKSGEIGSIKDFIPDFDRYIEPFFGGGALFFYLEPQRSAINDISPLLMDFYGLVRERDPLFRSLLLCYDRCFSLLYELCGNYYGDIRSLYGRFFVHDIDEEELRSELSSFVLPLCGRLLSDPGSGIILDEKAFAAALSSSAHNKIKRIASYNAKKLFPEKDIKKSLIAGFMSGFYKYFRDIYNLIASGQDSAIAPQYRAANFYFIREYCYGSMFRYNSGGAFNIPYGGISYNTKRLSSKIESMFSEKAAALLGSADLSCCDFERFLDKVKPGKRDFIFLDPPYDSDFSDYEGRSFDRSDQRRLAALLEKMSAQIMLVIEKTGFIQELYYDRGFNIRSFGSRYTYNVKSRNERAAEYLMITNFPV